MYSEEEEKKTKSTNRGRKGQQQEEERKISQESATDIHFSLIGQNGAARPPLAAREAVPNTIAVGDEGGHMGVGSQLM